MRTSGFINGYYFNSLTGLETILPETKRPDPGYLNQDRAEACSLMYQY
ncbi:hypothetical protein [Dyadobacter sp. NIV53]|nr:hypothetical protein [Dyadobacter sp. NIV53]